jgi:hypothetical protein
MRISVTLHQAQPGENDNQRKFEADYGGFNRRYAELMVDPDTGNGACILRSVVFPKVKTDAQKLTHFSIGVCFAPEGFGGSIITAGPLDRPIEADLGAAPVIGTALCGIYREKLELLGLIRCNEQGKWVELSEKELRAGRPLALSN